MIIWGYLTHVLIGRPHEDAEHQQGFSIPLMVIFCPFLSDEKHDDLWRAVMITDDLKSSIHISDVFIPARKLHWIRTFPMVHDIFPIGQLFPLCSWIIPILTASFACQPQHVRWWLPMTRSWMVSGWCFHGQIFCIPSRIPSQPKKWFPAEQHHNTKPLKSSPKFCLQQVVGWSHVHVSW